MTMKRFSRFSLRSLFVIVTIVALVLGSLQWIHGLLAIDPASEIVTCNGETVPVAWTQVRWEGDRSGVFPCYRNISANANPVYSVDARVVEQPLFVIRYADYSGTSRFTARGRVEGWYAPDWSDYWFDLHCNGGGITDGGFSCDYEFHDETRCLTVNVRQQINSSRIAKKATLRFVHDGEAFQFEGAVSQPAHGSGESVPVENE